MLGMWASVLPGLDQRSPQLYLRKWQSGAHRPTLCCSISLSVSLCSKHPFLPCTRMKIIFLCRRKALFLYLLGRGRTHYGAVSCGGVVCVHMWAGQRCVFLNWFSWVHWVVVYGKTAATSQQKGESLKVSVVMKQHSSCTALFYCLALKILSGSDCG